MHDEKPLANTKVTTGTPSSRWKRRTLPWQKMGSRILILAPQQKKVHELNASASLLWEILANETSATDLQRELMDRFHIDSSQASRDVRQFLTQAEALDLLEEPAR